MEKFSHLIFSLKTVEDKMPVYSLLRRIVPAAIIIFIVTFSFAADWPIYKGNIYFTGNNDEIIVKNSNLKWLFQADARIFNPVVSDGRIYFIDAAGKLYSVDEEFGTVVWKVNVRKVSSVFRAYSRAAGKVKYPLVMGNTLFLTDPIAVYAFNRLTGDVLWARTGMRKEDAPARGLAGIKDLPMVDGIYSDPVLHGGRIYYGTRNMFVSRETRNGHIQWSNRQIKSYSGFPTFYGDRVITQSMDYKTGSYRIYCIKTDTGKEIWSETIPKPLKIFPAVVYKQRVYLPAEKSIYCLDLKTGKRIWDRDYGAWITSSLSFTDRSILFSSDNSNIKIINPASGNLLRIIKVAPKSGPLFVTVRDHLYIAYTVYRKVKGRNLAYGRVKAVGFSDNKQLWNYETPFPGAVSQPLCNGGILFLPAGNYLYALGTEYYAKTVQGGSAHAVAPGNSKTGNQKPPQPRIVKRPEKQKIKLRKMKISVSGKDKQPVSALVQIKKRDKTGKVVYSKKVNVKGRGQVLVPDTDNVEIITASTGYLPKKVIVNRNDQKKDIILDRILQDKPIVVDNINFEFDSAYLKKNSLDLLDRMVRVLKGNSALKLEVRGHTDSMGDSKYNRKLSERRADAVIEYMVKNGVSPERLESTGFGETKPVASNDTKKGREKNRRTEFFFSK